MSEIKYPGYYTGNTISEHASFTWQFRCSMSKKPCMYNSVVRILFYISSRAILSLVIENNMIKHASV